MPESNGIRIARPTINVEGEDNASLAEGLLNLLIIENTAGLYRCEALFGNWGDINNTVDYLYFDRRTLDFGKSFKVKIGSDTIFDGKITGLEAHFHTHGPKELNVLAEDRFQDLRMTRRTRTFEDVSDSDVIRTIANDHRLTPSVDVTGPTYKDLAQINQSDLAFLRERARAINAELWMNGNTLNAKLRANRNGETLQLDYDAELREFSVLADLANQRTSVSVSGWDVSSKDRAGYEANDSVISGELGRDTSGASILSSRFGDRKESLAHTVPFTNGEAQAQAEAYFKLQARRFVVGRGVVETNPRLRVGNYVDLRGLGPLFSGKYYLSEVRHMFDSKVGICTAFEAERPGLGQPR